MASTSLIYVWRRWLAGLLVGCFVLACIRFALVQDIWIDEATQLSGVRLPVVKLMGWLSGTDVGRFGVPGDRMPPLAYLLDHLWWLAAGDAVTRFRMFHVLLTACGVAVVAHEEIDALGKHWLGVGTAFLVLSPKLITEAMELRSYSLFFAGTCVVMALFLNIMKRPQQPLGWPGLLVFGVACVALSYIHFFGVVASFAFFATLVLAFGRDRASLLRVVIVGAGVGLSLLGLSPFIFGAAVVSGSGSSFSIAELINYPPALFGRTSLLVLPVAAMSYFSGCGLLLLAATYGVARRALRHCLEPLDWLLVVALIGGAATILPALVMTGFSALKASYSIWLLPVLVLIVALGASKPTGLPAWDRYGRCGAVICLLLGAAIGTGIVMFKAPWFVNGPHRTIEDALARSAPASAVLYAGPDTYSFGYFPMVYQSGGRLPQWLAAANGVSRLNDAGMSPVVAPATLSRYPGLVVVEIRIRHYADLRACLHDRCPGFVAPAVVDLLVRGGRWSVASYQRAFGLYDTVVIRLTPKVPD